MIFPRTRALIEKAKGGDRPAFESLIERHRRRIEALIRARMGAHLLEEIEAEDVFQETVLKILEAISRFNWQGKDSFMRWVGTIAENVIRTAARKRERFHKVPLDSQTPGEDDSQSKALRRDERFDRFQGAFDSLDPISRKVIYLARIQGLPMKDVAKEIGRTPNAASIILYRALIKLKDAFGDTESFQLPQRRLLEKGSEDGKG